MNIKWALSLSDNYIIFSRRHNTIPPSVLFTELLEVRPCLPMVNLVDSWDSYTGRMAMLILSHR